MDELIGELEIIGDEDLLALLEDEIGAEGDNEVDMLLDLVSGEDDDYDDEFDEIGYDDEIGFEELIGAISRARRRRPRRRRRSRSRKGRKAARIKRLISNVAKRRDTTWAQGVQGGGVAVRRQQQRNARVLLLGGTATQGGVAGSLLVATTAQEIGRVDRLIITAVDAGGTVIPNEAFTISDVKVGTKSQFQSVDPVPGSMFRADTTGMGYALGLDTIQPGTNFSVLVTSAPAGSTFTFGTMSSGVR